MDGGMRERGMIERKEAECITEKDELWDKEGKKR